MVDETTGAVTITGYTVVHRESEWDDAARERAVELDEWEDGACPCGCGQRADLTLGEQVWEVKRFTCGAKRAEAMVKRDWEKSHEGQDEGWADGVVHYVVPGEDNRPPEKRTRRRRSGKVVTVDGD